MGVGDLGVTFEDWDCREQREIGKIPDFSTAGLSYHSKCAQGHWWLALRVPGSRSSLVCPGLLAGGRCACLPS